MQKKKQHLDKKLDKKRNRETSATIEQAGPQARVSLQTAETRELEEFSVKPILGNFFYVPIRTQLVNSIKYLLPDQNKNLAVIADLPYLMGKHWWDNPNIAYGDTFVAKEFKSDAEERREFGKSFISTLLPMLKGVNGHLVVFGHHQMVYHEFLSIILNFTFLRLLVLMRLLLSLRKLGRMIKHQLRREFLNSSQLFRRCRGWGLLLQSNSNLIVRH